jgi:hypothetical protein
MLEGMADTSTLSALPADRTHDLASEILQCLSSSAIDGRAYDDAPQARQTATLD